MSNQPSPPTHTHTCLSNAKNDSEKDQRVCLNSGLVKITPGHQLRSPNDGTFSVGFLKDLGVLTFFFGTCMAKGQTRAAAPHLEYVRPEAMENVSIRSLTTTLLLSSVIVLVEFELFLLSSLYVQRKARFESFRYSGGSFHSAQRTGRRMVCRLCFLEL